MSDAPHVKPTVEPSQPDAYRTIVRLVAGGIGEGIDRLMKVSAELDAAEPDPGDAVDGPIHADPTAMVVVGWFYELPETARGASEAAYRFTYPFGKVAGATVNVARFAAEVTGVAPFLSGLAAPMLETLSEERGRLVKVGTAEYARGRVLAVRTFDESVDGIVGLLSESEELGELVREQTIGITGSAVQEIRETSATADSLAEGILRKVLRRSPRQLPPMPEGDDS